MYRSVSNYMHSCLLLLLYPLESGNISWYLWAWLASAKLLAIYQVTDAQYLFVGLQTIYSKRYCIGMTSAICYVSVNEFWLIIMHLCRCTCVSACVCGRTWRVCRISRLIWHFSYKLQFQVFVLVLHKVLWHVYDCSRQTEGHSKNIIEYLGKQTTDVM